MKVRFAVSLGTGSVDRDHLAALVTGAEERGFDTVWFSDLPLMQATEPALAVAFAAGLTRRLKLGMNLVPFGHARFTVARQLAQLDQLTGGRLLVTLVPGVDVPGERAALDLAGQQRGSLLDALLPDLRRWWSGEAVAVGTDGEVTEVTLPVLPRQQPLELWLGGHGPQAIRRAGRLADGWLGSGSALGAHQAGLVCRRIQEEAAAAGRQIDPEHFGLSIPYARSGEDLRASSARRAGTSAKAAPQPAPPVGAGALRHLIGELIDAGMSKFVVRRAAPVESWPDELDWLADAILDLQS